MSTEQHFREHNWHAPQVPVGLVHVCKCTCFSTNTTLFPIYVPANGHDLCSTCTKEFCVERAEGCHGAQIADGSGDTATGFEGQVWAKCFVRDPTKDQSIVFFYLVCVFGLLLWSLIRSRVGLTFVNRLREYIQRA